MASPSHRADKLQMYQRYKDFAKAHSKGKLTLGEFRNEIIKQPALTVSQSREKNTTQIAFMNLMT